MFISDLYRTMPKKGKKKKGAGQPSPQSNASTGRLINFGGALVRIVGLSSHAELRGRYGLMETPAGVETPGSRVSAQDLGDDKRKVMVFPEDFNLAAAMEGMVTMDFSGMTEGAEEFLEVYLRPSCVQLIGNPNQEVLNPCEPFIEGEVDPALRANALKAGPGGSVDMSGEILIIDGHKARPELNGRFVSWSGHCQKSGHKTVFLIDQDWHPSSGTPPRVAKIQQLALPAKSLRTYNPDFGMQDKLGRENEGTFDKLKTMCNACGKFKAKSKCTKCHVRYCSKDCQIKAWKTLGHKARCGVIAFPATKGDIGRIVDGSVLAGHLAEFGQADSRLAVACMHRMNVLTMADNRFELSCEPLARMVFGRFVNAGGIVATCKAMGGHPSTGAVQTMGAEVLKAISLGDGFEQAVVDGGGIEALVGALGENAIAEGGIYRVAIVANALSNVCMGSDSAGMLRKRQGASCGAIEKLVECYSRLTITDPNEACGLLGFASNMIFPFGHPESCAREIQMHDAGLFSLAVKITNQWPELVNASPFWNNSMNGNPLLRQRLLEAGASAKWAAMDPRIAQASIRRAQLGLPSPPLGAQLFAPP